MRSIMFLYIKLNLVVTPNWYMTYGQKPGDVKKVQMFVAWARTDCISVTISAHCFGLCRFSNREVDALQHILFNRKEERNICSEVNGHHRTAGDHKSAGHC